MALNPGLESQQSGLCVGYLFVMAKYQRPAAYGACLQHRLGRPVYVVTGFLLAGVWRHHMARESTICVSVVSHRLVGAPPWCSGIIEALVMASPQNTTTPLMLST